MSEVDGHVGKVDEHVSEVDGHVGEVDDDEDGDGDLDGNGDVYDDRGKDDPNRILIFSTKSNLNIEIENWFINGTFAVFPELYYQIYTINIFVKGKNLPLIYALLTNKEKTTYAKFFTMLLHYIVFLPKSIITDFEISELNALKENKILKSIVLDGYLFILLRTLEKN